jgi:hypothetical protein
LTRRLGGGRSGVIERRRQLEDEIVVSNDHPGIIAAAQVHAVLALAATTALDSDHPQWFKVAASKLID